ncbi:MAG: TonB-dependent receptor, partial [Gammaproteobacteria bacterium]
MPAHLRRAALYASLLALASPAALSQVQLEEIIVTAQKREQSLQDVPISVNAVSGAKMEQVGITNLERMTAYVPNFSMNQTGISSSITVRGISSGINQSFEQSVGMYNDGIYFGKAQLTRLPLFDMERIEVLRGPQPILFGKNSIAGAVSLITAKPSQELEGSAQVLYEPDADERDYRFVVSGPLSDSFAARLSVLYREMDGWVENVGENRDERQEEEQVIRLGGLWDVNDDLSVQFKYENATFDTVGRNIELINDITREDNPPGARSYITGLTSLVGLLNNLVTAGVRTGPRIDGYVVDDVTQNQKRTAGAFDTSDN